MADWRGVDRLAALRKVFVEQSPPLHSFDEAHAWLESLSRYRDQWPEDHVAMVCDRGASQFLHGVPAVARLLG